MSDFTTGIQVGSGTQFLFVKSCALQSYTNSVQILPATSAGEIYGVWIDGCHIALQNGSPSVSSGIYVDSNGGAATNVAGIFLSNNLCYQFNNAGIQVNVAQDVTITGGQCSSNGLAPASTALGAGVAITGAAVAVTISGVNLSGVFPFQGSTQPYGLAVSGGGAANVTGCTMAGNGTAALYASSPGTLNIFSCQGYNTMATNLSNSTPTTATPITLASLGYYGPATWYVTGGTITHIRVGGTPSAGSGKDVGSTQTAIEIPSAQTYFELDYTGSPASVFIGS